MPRKKKPEEHVNHERWLVSYADFITLLFAFFTTMYAIGESDRGKAAKFITSVNTAFNRFDSILPSEMPTLGGRTITPLSPPGAGGGGELEQVFVFRDDYERAQARRAHMAKPIDNHAEQPLGKAPNAWERDEFGSPDTLSSDATPTPTPTPAPTPTPTPGAEAQAVAQGNGDEDDGGGGLSATGGMSTHEIGQVFAELQRFLDEEGLKGKVSLKDEHRGVVISLSEAAVFDPGKADLKISSRPLLDGIARTIEKLDHPIQVEGHTDNTQIRYSPFASNWELSAMRALRTAEYLVENYGLDQSSITPAGHGESRPIATNATPQGRARNRRVDIVILGIHSPESALPRG